MRFVRQSTTVLTRFQYPEGTTALVQFQHTLFSNVVSAPDCQDIELVDYSEGQTPR